MLEFEIRDGEDVERDCTCIKTCVEILLDYNKTIQRICTLLTTFYFVLRDN